MKTTELNGIALDWAVAVAREHKDIKIFAPWRPTDRGWIEVRFNPDPRVPTATFDPSINWEHGGPIIDRNYIWIRSFGDGYMWEATKSDWRQGHGMFLGGTALIAAMRCFVHSKLGDDIELPVEITRRVM